MTVGDLFRVIVFRETTDEDGDEVSKTVVELAAPREMLAQFAPQAVAAALGAPAQEVTTPKMATEGPTETPEQATQRRKRRTKAEMEAARMAEAAVSEMAAIAQVGETADTVIDSRPIPVETPTSGNYSPFGRG
jgi:hypothetical protein